VHGCKCRVRHDGRWIAGGGGASITSMTSSSLAWLKWIGGSRPGSYLGTVHSITPYLPLVSLVQHTPKASILYRLRYNLTSAYPAISALSKTSTSSTMSASIGTMPNPIASIVPDASLLDVRGIYRLDNTLPWSKCTLIV